MQRHPHRSAGTRKRWISAVIGGAGALAALFALGGQQASADYADPGTSTGRYTEIINWIEWGSQNNEVVLADSGGILTKENTLQVGAEELTVSCTIGGLDWHTGIGTGAGQVNGSRLTPPLVAYTPGSWAGDGLDNLYNQGGAATSSGPNFPANWHNPNEMAIGLANPNPALSEITGQLYNSDGTVNRTITERQSNGANLSFDFSCSATLDGEPVDLDGLVFADAESSSSVPNNYSAGATNNGPEWVEATVDSDVTWRALDQQNSCANLANAPYAYGKATGNTMRLGVNGRECAYLPNYNYERPNPNGSGPMAVAFMEGATSARVGLQGRGYSAIALGYVIHTDFGDAPASYGEAGALYQPTWKGGELDGSPITSSALASVTQPGNVILGSSIDAEHDPRYSDDGLGDDGAQLDDEDALDGSDLAADGFDLPVSAFERRAYVLEGVRCSGAKAGSGKTARVVGWIDWNGNGVFDADEGSDPVACGGTGAEVDLSWNVPADADPTAAYGFLRLRISTDENIAKPTGLTTDGEVEDYRVRFPAKVKVDKEWLVLDENGDELGTRSESWKYDADDPSDPGTAQVTETGTLPAEMEASPVVTPREPESLGWGQYVKRQSGDTGYHVGDVATIAEAEISAGDERCTVTSSTLSGTGIDGSIDLQKGEASHEQALPRVVNDYTIENVVICRSTLTLLKEFETRYAAPEEPREWELTAGTSPSALAVFPHGEKRTVAPGDYGLSEKDQAGYRLKEIQCRVDDGAWTTLDEKDPEHRVVGMTDNVCRFVNIDKPGSASWEKSDEAGSALSGSEWTLTRTGGNGSVPEQITVVDNGERDADPAAGSIAVDELKWGSYELVETRAPFGYRLDQTVRTFTIDGAHLDYGFADPIVNEQQDVPGIPLTGGMGADVFTLSGLGALGAAAAIVVVRRLRKGRHETGRPVAAHGAKGRW